MSTGQQMRNSQFLIKLTGSAADGDACIWGGILHTWERHAKNNHLCTNVAVSK